MGSEKSPHSLSVHESESGSVKDYVFRQYLPEQEVAEEVERIIGVDARLQDHSRSLLRGAQLANNPELLESYTESERGAISKETTHPIWSQSRTMFLLAIAASFAAVSFGMDESCVGGSQLQYQKQFAITNPDVQGLVLAAPYLAAGVVGVLVSPLEKKFGRRTMIFISSLVAFSGSLWQAFSNNTASLLVGRLYLGVSMVISSVFVPILVSESAPAVSRGAFLMLWQTFVAFGVMMGSVMNRAFVELPNQHISWRLMIGSSVVAPVITAALIFLPPESPRWLLMQGRYFDSLHSIKKLRSSEISATRDFYILYESLKNEHELERLSFWQQAKALVHNKRNRFALYVASAAVFGQQYGGVNILVSYTPAILTGAGVDPVTAIAGSIGVGGGCFLATFLSSQLIDRYGRRRMLLLTLPVEGLCLFAMGGVLHVANSDARLGAALLLIYVFVIGFGLGIGPISWTLVAEVFPLNTRSLGNSFAMSLNWILDFVLSMTWPRMADSMTVSGGLYFYGSWNIVLWVFTYFFIPETKRYTLEELDVVFSVGAAEFARGKLGEVTRFRRRLRGLDRKDYR